MASTRLLYIDILKAFTIYLVLWGHAIMHFQPDYKESYIFQVIYAFHMPLFMMLSGYFAISSMKMEIVPFIKKKFRQLLLPCISWGVLCWIFISSGLIHGEFHLELRKLFTGWLGLIDNFWFLKSCFICYFLAWLCWHCGKFKLFAIACVWFLCMLQGRFHLNMMFPSFIVGMYLRENCYVEDVMLRRIYIFIILFIALLTYKIYNQGNIGFIVQLVLGLSGSLSCIGIFKLASNGNLLYQALDVWVAIGQATLGIYVIQAILLETLMSQYISLDTWPIHMIVLTLPIMSLFVMLVCYEIVRLINCSDIMSFLLLGKEYRHR